MMHWRIQSFFVGRRGGAHSERGARTYNGGLGQSPQRGPVAEPQYRGLGGKVPVKLNAFLHHHNLQNKKIRRMFGGHDRPRIRP